MKAIQYCSGRRAGRFAGPVIELPPFKKDGASLRRSTRWFRWGCHVSGLWPLSSPQMSAPAARPGCVEPTPKVRLRLCDGEFSDSLLDEQKNFSSLILACARRNSMASGNPQEITAKSAEERSETRLLLWHGACAGSHIEARGFDEHCLKNVSGETAKLSP